MKKFLLILTTLAIIAGGVYLIKQKKDELANLPTPQPPKIVVEEATPKQMEVKQTKKVLGRYYALDTALIATKTPGAIMKILVEEGQKVKKGQLLMELDSSEVQAQIESQRKLIDTLQNQIKAQRASLKAAKLDARSFYKSLLRDRKLYRAGALAKEKLELAESLYAAKEAKLLAAEAALKAKENELAAAKSQLQAKKRLLDYSRITAPNDGVIGAIFFKEGSFAPLGKPLMELLVPPFVIDATFFEGITAGMEATALGKSCQVASILPRSQKSLSIARITCEALDLPHDTQVEVTIIQKRLKDYALPIQALYSENGKNFVFIKEKDGFKPTPVKIEVMGEEYFIPSPRITKPVAVGSNDKLAKLFLKVGE